MAFETFEHMAWAKRTETDARIDLAASGMPQCSWSDLGLDPREFPLAEPNYYGLPRWRRALAARFGVEEERVVPVAGASAALFVAVAAFAGPGDLVVAESPAYEALRRVPTLVGARVEPLPRRAEDRYALDLDAVRALPSRSPRLVLVSDLHNPTGAALSPEERSELVRAAERGGFHVLADEVYREFLPDPPAPLAAESAWIVSAGSLTKAYGLGPLRAGWMIASREAAERLRRVVDLSYVENASMAEAVAERALGRLALLKARTEALLAPSRRVLDAWLASWADHRTLRERRVPFVFLRLPDGLTGRRLSEDLLRRDGIAVVPGEFFGDPGRVRLSCAAAAPEALATALGAVGRALEQASREPGTRAAGGTG